MPWRWRRCEEAEEWRHSEVAEGGGRIKRTLMIAFQNLAYLGGAVNGHFSPTTHSISQTIGLANPAFLCGFTFW